MRIFQPLRQRAIALVWGSQVLSGIGDEMTKLAVVWLGAGLWGAKTGYLMALHAACALAASLFGGIWADRFHPKRVLVISDAVRAVAVLCVPVGAAAGIPLDVVLPLAIMVTAGFGALFEPALRGALPSLAPEPELQVATNALIESTVRFARVLGPGLVGVLGKLVPAIHLFTVDALTYLISGWALATVPSHRFAPAETPPEDPSLGLGSALRQVRGFPLLRYVMMTTPVVTAAWTLILPLGMGLLVHEQLPTDVSALAAVMLGYGIGNLSSNLLLGNYTGRPGPLLFGGRILAGAGFVAFAMAPNVPALMLTAGLAAAGGPATDLGFLGALQERFGAKDLSRVYRLHMALSFGGMLLLFFAAPTLFELFGIRPVIFGSGMAILIAGAVGTLKFGRAGAQKA